MGELNSCYIFSWKDSVSLSVTSHILPPWAQTAGSQLTAKKNPEAPTLPSAGAMEANTPTRVSVIHRAFCRLQTRANNTARGCVSRVPQSPTFLLK